TSSAPCRSNGKRPTEGQASDGALRLSGFGESTSVVFTSGQALTALRLLTFTRQDFAEAREPKPDYLVPAIRSLSSHSSRPTHLAAQYSSCYAPTAMIFRMRVPRAPLSHFVENLWFYQDLEVNYTKEKLLPDAAVEMIIDLGDGPKNLYDRRNTLRYTGYNRCWISGMQSRYLIIGAEKGSSMMGAHFRTGGAAPFFGFPISELTANVVELDLIWKREIVSLREQL